MGRRRPWNLASPTPTHYDVLGISPHASARDVRAAFVRLILRAHPDKRAALENVEQVASELEAGDAEASRLNEAWRVLGDAQRRTDYDAYLAREQARLQASKAQLTFALSVDLSLFTPQGSGVDEEEPDAYTYPCRCSGTFVITLEQLEAQVDIVACDSCSERCRVEYEVIDE